MSVHRRTCHDFQGRRSYTFFGNARKRNLEKRRTYRQLWIFIVKQKRIGRTRASSYKSSWLYERTSRTYLAHENALPVGEVQSMWDHCFHSAGHFVAATKIQQLVQVAQGKIRFQYIELPVGRICLPSLSLERMSNAISFLRPACWIRLAKQFNT